MLEIMGYLGSSLVNLKVPWRLVSKDMSKVFFNSCMVTVPHIEVKYYDMMACFTKKNVGIQAKLYQSLGLIPIFILRTCS